MVQSLLRYVNERDDKDGKIRLWEPLNDQDEDWEEWEELGPEVFGCGVYKVSVGRRFL